MPPSPRPPAPPTAAQPTAASPARALFRPAPAFRRPPASSATAPRASHPACPRESRNAATAPWRPQRAFIGTAPRRNGGGAFAQPNSATHPPWPCAAPTQPAAIYHARIRATHIATIGRHAGHDPSKTCSHRATTRPTARHRSHPAVVGLEDERGGKMQEVTRTRQEQLGEEEERRREEQAQGKTSRHMSTTSSKQVPGHSVCNITDRPARFGLKNFSLRELIRNSHPLFFLSFPSDLFLSLPFPPPHPPPHFRPGVDQRAPSARVRRFSL